MSEFWICFVPIFVAVDAIGLLPLFMSLTSGLETTRIRIIILQATVAAATVALLFILLGPRFLEMTGITVPDFMMAGGLLLLVISLTDMLTGEKRQRLPKPGTVGAVPIGVPLICGPGVLTTCMLLANTHGKGITILCMLLNVLLAGALFSLARPISRLLGENGSKTISKVASLLLAAIAVMLIRRGIVQAIAAASL